MTMLLINGDSSGRRVPGATPDDPSHSAAAPAVPPAAGGDREAARRRAERRAARISTGATELEQRLADVVRAGLASAGAAGQGAWEETAARMVDAQAPGLAARARELGAIPGSGPGWPVRLLEECALLHLLDTAWLGRDGLPPALSRTVRTRIGLPSRADGAPVRDTWLFLAQSDGSDGRLTTRRIWLHGRGSGRAVLLLSYGAAGRAPQLTVPVGLMAEAEVVGHGGAGQLRGDLGELLTPPVPISSPPPGTDCAGALAAYGRALGEDPWLDTWPVTLSGVLPLPTGSGWQLADADGGAALPLAPAALAGSGLWRLVAVSGGRPVTVFGEVGHRGVLPLTAWSAESPETVPLT
ncbi:hypothetical protein [Streptomyces sp. NPDC005805]|uniref:hypothetical protein n=1 Tax=Streptomyces sp. NPDC005805 TaxID=3157068 RepID=UPI003403F7CD